MKALVVCPTCQVNGRVNVLGEIFPDGSFGVLRFHQAITRIISDNFTIICDSCGEPVYVRNSGTVASEWQSRVRGVKFSGTFGTA